MKSAFREHAMQALMTMVVREKAKKEKRPVEDVLSAFRRSRTYAMLFDKNTGLWMNGPDYISEEYDLELERKARHPYLRGGERSTDIK